ncbi:glycoside hydrolase family 28 protein [Fusibacter sp. 3D3]|uniref:glycoside hydrolase family 28 protein n=1 Tax=Fusibacter sp. 3D3 TaxID=1048380 RepID=UPI000852C692|nr:glycoside hydrolase family 28 protein [Fusibacter sp. 3D3]GAU75738.1 polygalacturonase [Fusibacter sp. 3D3]
MNINPLLITSRSITLEIENESSYYSEGRYDVFVNGQKRIENENKNVISLFNLEPNALYDIEIVFVGQKSEKVKVKTLEEWIRLNVKKFGAKGDGIADDTAKIQAAILAAPEGATLLIPKGTYLTRPLFLKSHMTLELSKGATLKLSTDRKSFPILPGYSLANNEVDEYLLGTWEGNPLDMFASLITGIGVENVRIIGEGTLDGDAQNGPWWGEPRTKPDGAFRPRMVFLKGCKNITLQGITVQNSPCWTIHPYLSEDLKFIDLKVRNPKDSANTDGIDPESCNRVDIIGVDFSVGDDCIAIKSGKLYMGMRYQKPSENFNIRNCIMKHGHGAVVIGSEMSGGVKNINVEKCVFQETDRGLRIKTRRGRGKYAVIENINFDRIVMERVLTPFVINMFYFCDPDGKSEYVYSRAIHPVDDWTPSLGAFKFKNIICRDSEVAAGYFTGLPEMPIRSIEFENIVVDFKEEAQRGRPAMMDYIDAVSKLGFYFMNVDEVIMNNVKLENHVGEPVILESVKQYTGTL